MIEEPGVVVAVDVDGVWVATQRKSTCGSCSARMACGQGLLNSLSTDKKPHSIKVATDLPLVEGDQVTLVISQQSLISSALLVYMLPLLSMFVAAFAADYLNATEPWIIFAAVLGFSSGALGVRFYSDRYLDGSNLQPVICKVQKPSNLLLKCE
ncbi:MAG TPA: SoxR reducing system RseC family protein [Thiopseudomonas sp.]|nr:SoxR reducing system RseC family protein [Thiopseudomonas sp.]